MRKARAVLIVLALAAAVAGTTGCQRTVQVKTGTQVADESGRIVSADVRTVRVPMGEAAKYRVVTVTQESTLGPLYEEAQAAIAAGDLGTAERKLAEVLAISPSYRKAKQQLDAIKAGKKVAADTGEDTDDQSPPTKPSTPSTTTPSPPSQSDTGLMKWIPNTLGGFKASKALVDPLSVSRQYTPTAGQNVATLIIVAEQFRTSKEAKRALASDVKGYYSKNDDTLTVNGHEVYFGTDGRRFAAIGFVDGAVMVAVEGSVDSGPPTSLKGLLTGIVEQLP